MSGLAVHGRHGQRGFVTAHPGLLIAGATEVTSPSRALTEASNDAAILVVGSRGYGRVLGALLGSVAFAVAAQARCPVIVVKDEAVDSPVGPEHRVVVGTDGSPEAAAAVGFAASRAVTASAALEIITCTGGHQIENVDVRELRASATRIAEAAAHRVRAIHHRLIMSTRVEDSTPELALIDASADAGLVVVGTRGRGAFKGMFLGLHLLFTPGVYHLDQTLQVNRADTVVLGLGLATIVPDNGVTAMKVADVDGVSSPAS